MPGQYFGIFATGSIKTRYSLKFKDINEDDITMHLLPGKSSLDKIGSYRYWIYHHDEEKTLELLYDIYNLEND